MTYELDELNHLIRLLGVHEEALPEPVAVALEDLRLAKEKDGLIAKVKDAAEGERPLDWAELLQSALYDANRLLRPIEWDSRDDLVRGLIAKLKDATKQPDERELEHADHQIARGLRLMSGLVLASEQADHDDREAFEKAKQWATLAAAARTVEYMTKVYSSNGAVDHFVPPPPENGPPWRIYKMSHVAWSEETLSFNGGIFGPSGGGPNTSLATVVTWVRGGEAEAAALGA